MDKKSYDNGSDFSFVEQKVREVQTTIENAVKTSNYQELNQSITRMVNSTLKQYQKEHPEKAGYRKPCTGAGAQKVRGTVENTETHPELYGNTGGEKVKDILLIVFGGIISGSMAIGLPDRADSAGGHGTRRYRFHSCDTNRYTCRSRDDRQRMHWSGQTETFSEIQKNTGTQNIL